MLSSDDTAPSSTPARDNAVFSDEPTRAPSPPSSPPGFPWEQQSATRREPQTVSVPRTSAFSVLGKRKVLADVSDNVRSNKKHTAASIKADTRPLAQMQISLGQEVQKKCKTCGMEYVASSAEDRKLHDKYHKQNTEGYDVGKDFVQKAGDATIFKGANSVDRICTIDCFDKPARKRRAQAVLDIVQRELGAVPIPETDIWEPKGSGEEASGEPNYRAYMYIRSTRCIGFLLVERITEARRVLEPETVKRKRTEIAIDVGAGALSLLKARKQAAEEAAREAATQPIQLSRQTHPAKLGVSRIWTSPHHRHQNVATTLLDTAVMHANQRVGGNQQAGSAGESHEKKWSRPVKAMLDKHSKPMERSRNKEDVAFSQPTEAGARLSRRWFGKLYGWAVYVD